ncbi:MAG: hypothetical protein JOZ87_07550 [Chloroflexi bacterium]|nr:hypothetical protein [Chloroflexota bacterium]
MAAEPAYRPKSVVRDVDAGANLQALLVSAITAVLVTRLYLSMTGYPRIGDGTLHIAHLLWGGLLMLAAQILVLSVLGKRARRLAAITGGIGLGLFVDEIGKFVTTDNDYFFRPAIAMIYIIFIVLFLVFRAIEHRSLSPQESLVNSAEMLTDLILDGATRAEVARTRWLLRHSACEGTLVDGLRLAIAGAVRVQERKSALNTITLSAWRTYDRLLRWRLFQHAVLVVFVGQAVFGLVATLVVGWQTLSGGGQQAPTTLISSSASLACALLGLARLSRSRLDAYRWFERSLLISVFFTQVILFWQDQLAALWGLGWALVLLTVLRFMIRQEAARTVTER